MYLDIVRVCGDNPGIIVEAANDTGVVSDALVAVKSLDTGIIMFSSITDVYGSAAFSLPFGNFTITVTDSKNNIVSRNYELYCQQEAKVADVPEEDNNSIILISGQSVQTNLSAGDIPKQNPGDVGASELLVQQSSLIFIKAFLVFVTSASLIFIFSLVLLLILYRRDSTDIKDSTDIIEAGRKKIYPAFVILEDKNVLAKRLTPVEEATIKIEGELKDVNQENNKRDYKRKH
jgi:hypothetical protein